MATNRFDERNAFVRMTREYPIRTCIYTFGLPLFGLVQLINGYLHGGSLLYISIFCVTALVCSVLLTQYQIATFRRKRITRRWT